MGLYGTGLTSLETPKQQYLTLTGSDRDQAFSLGFSPAALGGEARFDGSWIEAHHSGVLAKPRAENPLVLEVTRVRGIHCFCLSTQQGQKDHHSYEWICYTIQGLGLSCGSWVPLTRPLLRDEPESSSNDYG